VARSATVTVFAPFHPRGAEHGSAEHCNPDKLSDHLSPDITFPFPLNCCDVQYELSRALTGTESSTRPCWLAPD
jgi:hypothetical protein